MRFDGVEGFIAHISNILGLRSMGEWAFPFYRRIKVVQHCTGVMQQEGIRTLVVKVRVL